MDIKNNSINIANKYSNKTYSNNIEIIKPGDVGKLEKDDFLHLMLAQLKNQDPMSPLDNNQFTNQMVQFSTIESLGNIGKKITNIEKLLENKLGTAEINTPNSVNTTDTNNVKDKKEAKDSQDIDALLHNSLIDSKSMENSITNSILKKLNLNTFSN